MKRALVVLLALAFAGAVYAADAPKPAAAAAAPAPALKIGGYINTGVRIVNDAVAETTTYQSYGDDWGAVGTSATVTATVTGPTSGFLVRVYGNSEGVSATNTAVVDKAYGWMSPMAGLKLFAGQGYNDAFDGIDDDTNDYFYSNGVSAMYSMSGFSVGAGMNVTKTALEDANYILGAAYELDKVVKVRFNANTNADIGLDRMSLSASLLMVPGLTLTGGYLAENMGDEVVAVDTNNWIDATVGYQIMPALAARVVFYDFLFKEYMTITPRVTYVVNPMLTVYGQFAYVTEGADAVTYYATMKPRVNATFKLDATSKVWGQVEYDTEKEKATVLLQYLYSF